MELEQDRKIGGRVLRAGQLIRIKGWRGDYKIDGFADDRVWVYGQTNANKPGHRSATLDRIGKRERLNARGQA